jgi:FKBP-type peptidyl-prolyl cis-trans isomerase
MKTLVAIVLLIAAFAAAFWWFNRPQSAAVASAPSAPAVPVEDPKRAERLALFGDEASAPGTQWRESGLGYRIIAEGTPPKPGIGSPVRIIYTGRLKDGTVFDRSEKPSEFLIGTTVPGLSTGLQMLGTGGKAVFLIPPSLGYGNRKVMGIPAGSGLIFDVEVTAVNP